MSNLVLHNNNVASELAEFERRKTGKIVCKTDINELKNQMHSVVAKTALDSASKLNADDQAYVTLRMSNIVQIEYPNLTIREIDWAFEQAIQGKYGEFFGVNVKSLCNVLSHYNKARCENLKKLHVKNSKQNLDEPPRKHNRTNHSYVMYWKVQMLASGCEESCITEVNPRPEMLVLVKNCRNGGLSTDEICDELSREPLPKGWVAVTNGPMINSMKINAKRAG